MEIKGKIIQELPLQEGVSKAGNNWKKKEWILETVDTQYPRKVKFTLFGDRVDTVRVELGKVYYLGIDIESREYNGRWYTDVNAFSAREDVQGTPMVQETQPPFQADPFSGAATADTFSGGDAAGSADDLPF